MIALNKKYICSLFFIIFGVLSAIYVIMNYKKNLEQLKYNTYLSYINKKENVKPSVELHEEFVTKETKLVAQQSSSLCGGYQPSLDSYKYIDIVVTLRDVLCIKGYDESISCADAANKTYCENTDLTILNKSTGTTEIMSLNEVKKKFGYNINFTVQMLNESEGKSYVCLMMQNINGYLPVSCKQAIPVITEPLIPVDQYGYEECKLSKSCFDPAYTFNHTQFKGFGYSGRAYQCVIETLQKVFYDDIYCVSGAATNFRNSDGTAKTLNQGEMSSMDMTVNSFSYFRLLMKQTVSVLLMLYMVYFGFQILFDEEEEVGLQTFALAGFKIICVIYFSVGFNAFLVEDTKDPNKSAFYSITNDGVRQLLIPILKPLSDNLTLMAFTASVQDRPCREYIYGNKYDNYGSDYKYYAMFDAMDCKMFTYLGFNLAAVSKTMVKGLNDQVSQAIKKVFFLMLGLFIFALPLISMFIHSFVIYVALSTHFVGYYILFTISFFILLYFAPIFVPMALFDFTNDYFDGWMRAVLGACIQPIFFMSMYGFMISFYDQVYWGGCGIVSVGDEKNLDFSSKSCQASLGASFVKFWYGDSTSLGAGSDTCLIIPLLFFAPKICMPSIQSIFSFTSNMLTLYVLNLVMYKISDNVVEFSAEISNGLSQLGGVQDRVEQSRTTNMLNNAEDTGKNFASDFTKSNKEKAQEGGGG
jgi:type IV secretory pathway VirB6-like protein